MAAARGGLIESRTEVEKASPKGTKAAITALMSTFPYPNDVWADAKTPTSPNLSLIHISEPTRPY